MDHNALQPYYTPHRVFEVEDNGCETPQSSSNYPTNYFMGPRDNNPQAFITIELGFSVQIKGVSIRNIRHSWNRG